VTLVLMAQMTLAARTYWKQSGEKTDSPSQQLQEPVSPTTNINKKH
jgi:hypothetical protein